ncbi:MAG: AAA family ATPase [Egibacteraceae bacterium]
MKPVGAKIEGYRRFGESNHGIDLRGDLLAVVGPNEAGKSSLLDALLRFGDSDPIDGDDLTRSGDGTARIEVVYRLDDEDKASLHERFDPALSAEVTRLVVARDHKGRRSVLLRGRVPKPSDLLDRPIKKLAAARKKHGNRLDDETATELIELLDALASGKPPTEPPRELRAYADSTLAEPEADPADRQVAEALNRVLRLAHRNPNQAMSSYLWKHRAPEFLKFTTADRDLRAAYTITEKGKERWNAALHNLARFSGLG